MVLTQNNISKENIPAKILFFYRTTKHYIPKIKIQHTIYTVSNMNQINMDSKKI